MRSISMRIKHLLLAVLFVSVASKSALAGNTLPPFFKVQRIVESSLTEVEVRRPNDLISRSEVSQALDAVKKLGWDLPANEILGDVLDDQHVLVRTFRTSAGKKFMAKVSGRELMYDRLDRISTVSGGSQLIQDLVKLPDGEKYAKPRSGQGVPDLLDLLPKGASGRTRRITDYDKPTGRIYTSAELINRLAELYKEAELEQRLNGSKN